MSILSFNSQRAEREKKHEQSEMLWNTARVMEVSLESSFQPTIQLYVIFPVLLRTLLAEHYSLKIFDFCKRKEGFPFVVRTDQTLSIVTSVLRDATLVGAVSFIYRIC